MRKTTSINFDVRAYRLTAHGKFIPTVEPDLIATAATEFAVEITPIISYRGVVFSFMGSLSLLFLHDFEGNAKVSNPVLQYMNGFSVVLMLRTQTGSVIIEEEFFRTDVEHKDCKYCVKSCPLLSLVL